MTRTARAAGAARTDRFESRGRPIRAHRTGDAAAATCVLVHGIGTGSRTFRRLAPHLAAAFRTVAVDLSGFAGLPKPRPRMVVEDHAEVLTDYLDSLGAPPVLLVGHSMGTQIVLDVAARRPDLVSHLVLIGPVTNPRERTAGMQALRLAQDTMHETPATNWTVFSDYLRCGPSWYLKALPSMLDYDTLGVLTRIRTPTLVVRGEHDPIAPHDWAARLAAAGGHTALFEVPDAHHVAMYTHPAEVAAAIEDWLA